MVLTRFVRFFTSVQAALLLLIVSLGLLIIMVETTSPLAVGPAGVLAVFLLLYLGFWAAFLVGQHVYLAVRYRVQQPAEGEAAAKRRQPSSRAVLAAAGWAIAPIVIVALSSTKQLDLVSVMLLVIFEVLATVYVFRR